METLLAGILAIFCIGLGLAIGCAFWYLIDTLTLLNRSLKQNEKNKTNTKWNLWIVISFL